MMKILQTLPGLAILGALWVWTWAAPAVGDPPELRHQLTVTLEPEKHTLHAVDTVQLSLTGQSRIEFELAHHLTIESVRVDDKAGSYTFTNGRLRIALPDAGDEHRLRIAYHGRFNDPVPQEPLNTDNPGFGVTGTIQPQGVMLLAGAGWYPESTAWHAAFELTVNAPEGVLAVTAGKPLGHITENGRTQSRWSIQKAWRAMSLAAGPYQVSTRRFGRVTAATYFSKPLQHLSSDYLEATGRYLQLYESLFGPYAFDQFAVVENFFPTGYGFPSFTLLGGQVLKLPFILHTSLGHEIAHCWWGNGVLVDPSQGNWSEGLTTYVADYLYKERQGEGQDRRLQWLRNYAGLVNADNDFSLSRFSGRTDPATRIVGYDKGAMVFHMLRQTVGDDLFWQSLRDIYARHRFEAITWSDIRAAFEQRSGLSLERFFQQWVFSAGAPGLALSDVTIQAADRRFSVGGSVTQTAPYYDLALELALQTDHETVRKTLSLSGERTSFTITADGRPQQLTVDPEFNIFRRLAPEEVPPTINTLKGSAAVRVVVARSLGSDGLETARRLTVSLGLAQAPINMENELPVDEPAGSDWILVGLPADRTLWPDASDRFRASPERFVLEGKSYARNAATFFGVFNNPFNKKRTVALFMPADPSLARTISAKITHYGQYSYLVFDASRNQLKGTWDTDQSPLTVRWPASLTTGERR